MEYETQGPSSLLQVSVASLGFGSLANSMLNLVNIASDNNKHEFRYYDTAGIYSTTTTTTTVNKKNHHYTSSSPEARSINPVGVGAITPYVGRVFYATKYIPSGMELFLNYGTTYFQHRQDMYQNMPLMNDYHEADTIITKFRILHWKLCNNTESNNNAGGNTSSTKTTMSSSTSSASKNHVDKVDAKRDEDASTSTSSSTSCTYDPIFHSVWNFIVQDMKQIWTSDNNNENESSSSPYGGRNSSRTSSSRNNVLQAFPATIEEMEVLMDWNGTIGSGSTAYQHYERSIRSLDWLQTNGICIDKLTGGISTATSGVGGGRGAFATRFISQGSIISSSPVLQLPNKSILDMYNFTQEELTSGILLNNKNGRESDLETSSSKPIHKQLLLNYCFGHNQSTLLLCPYGLLTGLINHSGENFNAKIEWNTKLPSARKYYEQWKTMPLEEWAYSTKHTGLVFDYVATRNIEVGEEILIDYGFEWELAWKEHVANFPNKVEPKDRYTYYVPASELNKLTSRHHHADAGDDGDEYIVRTRDERPYYLDDVVLRIHNKHYIAQNVLDYPIPKNVGREEVVILQRNKRVIVDSSKRRDSSSPSDDDSGSVDAVKEEYRYLVQVIWIADIDDANLTCEVYRSPVLWDVPIDAFYFEDLPRSRDHSQSWSFRHEMMIPVHIFPEPWKNLKDYVVDDGDGKDEL